MRFFPCIRLNASSDGYTLISKSLSRTWKCWEGDGALVLSIASHVADTTLGQTRCSVILTFVRTVQPVLLAKQNIRFETLINPRHDQQHCWTADGQGE